jgi:tRNA-2-methylthio-N6-dimethylallyladenosine synthase
MPALRRAGHPDPVPTGSIRDKADQKVFHRFANDKKLQAQGKKFGVLECVAQ